MFIRWACLPGVMRLGVGLPSKTTPGKTIPASRFRRFVTHAAEFGFGSGWVLEHLIEPPSYQTSFGDPLTVLGAAAGAASELDLGTAILILPMRHPVHVAKRAATLQRLMSGRLTLGVGQGYIEAEYAAVGVPYEERSARFTEGVELLGRLLREDEVTFDGTYYAVDEFQLEPRLERPPRLLVAGGGRSRNGEWHVADGVLERMVHGDGWIASSGANIEQDWAAIAAFLETTGMDPAAFDKVGLQHIHFDPGSTTESIRRRQYGVFTEFIGDDRGFEYAENNLLVGPPGAIQSRLESYEVEGFDEVILHPAANDPSELDRQLALWASHLLPTYS